MHQHIVLCATGWLFRCLVQPNVPNNNDIQSNAGNPPEAAALIIVAGIFQNLN